MTDVNPLWGSANGGQRVTITGEGFTDVPKMVKVKFGHVPCKVEESSYNEVIKTRLFCRKSEVPQPCTLDFIIFIFLFRKGSKKPQRL